jgi:hypothetical protein
MSQIYINDMDTNNEKHQLTHRNHTEKIQSYRAASN